MRCLILLAMILISASTGLAEEKSEEADVVIYGGTSSGVAAAVQATRMDKSVVLIEPGKHLGGLTSGGLGWTDSGNKAVIGGIAKEFYQRVKKHYDNPGAWKYGKRESYDRYRPKDDAMWTFEPHIADRIMNDLTREARVKVVLNEPLDRSRKGIVLRDGRIKSIRLESGRMLGGKMFIDATYEGDLMALAAVTYTVGRESNHEHKETLNGIQKAKNTHLHRFVVDVDPYIKAGDPSSGVLPGVHGDDPGEDGSGDHRVQAYCFRMCMSNVTVNRLPFPKPDGYDEQRYELLLRNFEAGDLRLPLKPDMMPNGKTDTNNNCAFSTDNIGMNYDYPEASYERRAEIIREHETYQKGLMWTLANHPRVPESVRRKMSVWGLPKDEFKDNGNWPHQIYVREARRMVSDYVMTENDCRRIREIKDSVGMGSYNMDSHNCQRYITPDGFVQNEGDIQVSPGGPYMISYRSIVPKRDEVKNLLVPVCVSSSHIAYGSIRMEPVFMVLGQSAATAACQAIDGNTSVQEVDYEKLQERLIADKQVLTYSGLYGPSISSVDPTKLAGIVIDDSKAELNGEWLTSASIGGFVGTGYLHDNDESKGEKSATFSIEVNKTGRYEVRLAYTANPNRATNVPVTIESAGKETIVIVNQRQTPNINKTFMSLGKFQFESAAKSRVVVSNDKTDGHVIVDAVQLLPFAGKD